MGLGGAHSSAFNPKTLTSNGFQAKLEITTHTFFFDPFNLLENIANGDGHTSAKRLGNIYRKINSSRLFELCWLLIKCMCVVWENATTTTTAPNCYAIFGVVTEFKDALKGPRIC